MIGALYGSLPVVHDTGGLHDTITHLNVPKNSGNGFLFEHFTSEGLFWAIEEAMRFFNLPQPVKQAQVERIMRESLALFNHDVCASRYIDLYETMLKRPLVQYTM